MPKGEWWMDLDRLLSSAATNLIVVTANGSMDGRPSRSPTDYGLTSPMIRP